MLDINLKKINKCEAAQTTELKKNKNKWDFVGDMKLPVVNRGGGGGQHLLHVQFNAHNHSLSQVQSKQEQMVVL